MENTIAIVGRPNVGKSSLFNKLVNKRKAIVHNAPGVTRDRLYQETSWSGQNFQVIDTGGIAIADQPFQAQIKLQAQIAIEEATVIIFVVDGQEGITADDQFIAQILRKSNKKVLLAANKLENNKEFDSSIWSLGFKEIFKISAIHGEGIGDLLDKALTYFKPFEKVDQDLLKIAIIGRPNAGKSSLLNALANEERTIVSKIAGTTRDAINSNIEINERLYTFIDTAGINRKSKLVESVEHYALARAQSAISNADLVLLVIDYNREIAHFDSVVAGYAFEQNKAIIIVINKWDQVDKKTMTMKQKEKEVRKHFKFISWAPTVFLSAKTKLRLTKLKEKIIKIDDNLHQKIKTSVLNEVISDIQIVQPAQSNNGGRLNVKFVRQVDAKIPTFIFWVNQIKYLHFTYQRFLQNQLREYFGFEGVPLKLVFREGERKNYGK